MCSFLGISRSYYYKLIRLSKAIIKIDKKESFLEERILAIWKSSRKMYGSRKISKMLEKEGIAVSSFIVLKLMKRMNIASYYHVKSKHPYNKNKIETVTNMNILNQKFDGYSELEVLTSDLTYVNIGGNFGYVCFVVDLFNREIVAYGTSLNHDSKFVFDVLANIDLDNTHLFHSDQGGEYKNTSIKSFLDYNDITQSFSRPGVPQDNSISEGLFAIFKREWAKTQYNSIQELEIDVKHFVHNYNYFRIHSKLGYKSPVEYRLAI